MKKTDKTTDLNTEDIKLSDCFQLKENKKSSLFHKPLLAYIIIKTSAVALTVLLIYLIIFK